MRHTVDITIESSNGKAFGKWRCSCGRQGSTTATSDPAIQRDASKHIGGGK